MDNKNKDNASSWMPLGMLVGTSLGLLYGVVSDNMVMGLCIGPSFGLLLGTVIYALTKKDKK